MNNDDILELTETEVALEAAFESYDGLSNILDAHVQGKLTDPRFVTDISNTFIGRLGLETIGSNVSMEDIVNIRMLTEDETKGVAGAIATIDRSISNIKDAISDMDIDKKFDKFSSNVDKSSKSFDKIDSSMVRAMLNNYKQLLQVNIFFTKILITDTDKFLDSWTTYVTMATKYTRMEHGTDSVQL